MKEPKIKILILNYNGKAFLKECLDSVMTIDYSNYSVVLIDNNSTDDSIKYVRSLYDNVEIIQQDPNSLSVFAISELLFKYLTDKEKMKKALNLKYLSCGIILSYFLRNCLGYYFFA